MPKLNLFAISGLAIVVAYLPMMIFVAKELRNNIKLLPFFLHQISVFIWGIGSIFLALSQSPSEAEAVWRWAYSAVIFIPVFFYHACLNIFDIKNDRFLKLIYLQGFFFLIIHLTGGLFNSMEIIPHWGYYPQGNHIFFIQFSIWIIITVIANGRIYKLLKTSHTELQDRLFVGNSIIGFAGGSTNFLGFFNIPSYPVGNFFIALNSIISTYAIFRGQYLNIRIVIKKSLIYTILISIISITYLTTVVIFERFLQNLVGYQSLVISGFLTFGLGLFFIPLKNAIEMLVNRYFFKGSPEELSEQIEKFNQEVQQREKYKLAAELIGNVAHEIKNPLTSIRTFIEQFPSKKNNPEFMDKFHKLACNELERVQQLSLQLTDFAKPEELKLSEFNTHGCLDDVLMLINNKLKHQDIRLVKQFAPGPLTLTADRDQIKQVLLNLILNAIDAMPDGGTLTVTTSSCRHPEEHSDEGL